MHSQRLELADIFRAGFEDYCTQYGPLPAEHYRVAHAILACRTAALGGHTWDCDECSNTLIAYNSCRNRHCPSCQAAARADWVDKRIKELLPVPYFHVVFTIPSQLNPFALSNKAAVYRILFAAASQTLLELGHDPRRLGAQMGFVAVLHTWGSNLMDHPHLHCIVPAGGLDDDRWVGARSREFLLPVKVMGALFRGKFLALLRKAIDAGEVTLHGRLASYEADPDSLRSLFDSLYRTDWVVYAKPPFGGAKAVVKYLGRYTHRIAIANSRLVSISETHVTFRYKDYADKGRWKLLRLTISEFIRRFLLHVVPRGFVRIRSYGFLSCRTRSEKLLLCRDQLCAAAAERLEQDTVAPPRREFTCPVCGRGRMVRAMRIDKPEPGGGGIAEAA